MEIILIALIVYLGYREFLFAQTVKDLTLKLISKNSSDYSFAKNLEKESADLPVSDLKEDPYLPLDESPIWDDYKTFKKALNGEEIDG